MTPSCLVINDIPGIHKVASHINLPILNACGIQTGLIPTMVLSSHMGYKPVIQTMDQSFSDILDHILSLPSQFQAIFSGYFANPDEIKNLQNFIHHYPHPLKLFVDPIMGDHGRLYSSFNGDYVSQMQDYLSQAYCIFPNLTEACLLTHTPFQDSMSKFDLELLSDKLLSQGSQHVIITGIKSQREDKIGFYYQNQTGDKEIFMHDYAPLPFYGTGDLAASLITGLHLRGLEVSSAIQRTGNLLAAITSYSMDRPGWEKNSLSFEPFLGPIADLANQID